MRKDARQMKMSGKSVDGYLKTSLRWRGRAVAAGLFILMLSWFSASAGAEPIVRLSAENLPEGPLDVWVNEGTLGGEFRVEDPEHRPLVERVARRQAVTYGRDGWMKSTFTAPDGITGNSPFTLIVRIYAQEVGGKEVHTSWSSRPGDTAEFAYGHGREGAFTSFGSGDTGFRREPPPARRWHHIAYTYEPGSFRIYVNGDLDFERDYNLSTKPGEPMYLGTAWYTSGRPAYGFRGSVSELKVFDRALSHREIRQDMGRFNAFLPSPANGEEIEALQVDLAWTPGDDAADFRVYLSDEYRHIQSREPFTVMASHENISVMPGSTYYWQVDQLNEAGIIDQMGDIWEFSVSRGPSRSPQPRDGFGNVAVDNVTLSWQTGPWAESQNVYFGTDATEVAESDTPAVAGLSAEITEIPLPAEMPLAHGHTYYWRVEQLNGELPDSPGEVWSFRTVDVPRQNHVTFLAATDTHFNLSEIIRESNLATIDMMNAIPGKELPEAVGGGIVRTPRGVTVAGDLVDHGSNPVTGPPSWDEFVEFYGLDGTDGKIAYPVYEGLGNHDGGRGDAPQRAMRERNPHRPNVAMISENGLHYSWDWDHVHLVQLNYFAGSGPEHARVNKDMYNPQNSLEFLEKTLAEHVGDSGRPVVLVQHYGFDGWGKGWFEDEARDLLEEALDGYNIALIIAGHNHAAFIGEWRGYRYLSAGAAQRGPNPGDFFVIQIEDDEMVIAHWTPNGWSNHVARVSIAADN